MPKFRFYFILLILAGLIFLCRNYVIADNGCFHGMWEGPAEKDFYFKVKEANNGCLLKKINHKFKRGVNFSYKYVYKEMPNGDVIKTHYPTLSLFDLLSSKYFTERFELGGWKYHIFKYKKVYNKDGLLLDDGPKGIKYIYDDNGNILFEYEGCTQRYGECHKDVNKCILRKKYEYDNNGKLQLEYDYKGRYDNSGIKYEYDSTGKLKSTYNYGGPYNDYNLYEKFEYYDNDMLKTICNWSFYSSGYRCINTNFEYKYYNNGNIKTKTIQKGAEGWKKEFFDSGKIKVESKCIGLKNLDCSRVLREYDQNGNLIYQDKETLFNREHDDEFDITNFKAFGEKNIKKNSNYWNWAKRNVKYKNVYDENNKLKEVYVYDDENDRWNIFEKIVRDKKGNIILQTFYNDNQIIEKVEYKYSCKK